MFQHLLAELEPNGVAVVHMNRPPVNAVNQEMYIELIRLFSDPDQLGDVRAIVLAGKGRHFCGGNCLDEFANMTPENGVERMWRVREAFFAIMECPVPVIGAVHGVALGTGLAIAASCDVIVAEPDARFGLPELTVGVMGGARHLGRIAAQPLVRRMFLTGEQLSGEQMAQAGSPIVVSAPGQVLETAKTYAARSASFSPTAVRAGKRILNRIETMDIRSGYEFEQRFTVKMAGHPDSKEALAAFREKRAPVYQPLSDVTGV
jgi:enoyl-CoA hydratase/carnithine racemase